MDALLWTLAGTALVSVISFVGVVGLSFREKMVRETILVFVALSAGVLIGDAFFHLIPDALAGFAMGGTDALFAYVLAGFVVFFLLEKVVHWRHCHDVGCKVHTFGYMNLAGDAVHNFIDGLIIAAAFVSDVRVGLATVAAIIMHEIPQELGDFGVLVHSGFSKRRAIAMNFLTALVAVAGGVVGIAVSSYASVFADALLPIAAGGFLYIAASDLIPEIRAVTDTKKSIATFAAFVLGIAFMWAAKIYLVL
jgi:zinc and cadmium transporter